MARPDFGPEPPLRNVDFNDLAGVSLQAVRDAINNALPVEYGSSLEGLTTSSALESWPEPQPLAAKIDAEPYPLDALPDAIRAAVEEVQGFTKAPVPLVASSALAALSLAIQSHFDAKRADKLTGPVSLFLLTIADSGERKSTCDGYFSKAIRDYQETQAGQAKEQIRNHKAAFEAWEAKRAGIKEQIKQSAKGNNPTWELETGSCPTPWCKKRSS